MSDDKNSSADLKDLDDRLKKLRASVNGNDRQDKTHSPHPIGSMMWLAFNVVSELVGGVVCGLAVGWGLDKWLDTRPVFIAVFLVFGCVAAVLNVVRYLKNYDEKKRQNEKNLKE